MRRLAAALLLTLGAVSAADALCGFTDVGVAVQAACAIKATDSTIQCWGDGSGNNEQVAPAGTYTAIDGDYLSFCGVKTDGSLHCWGESLGAATPSGTTWVDVAVGVYAACGLKNDGDVDCWGTYAPTAPTNTMSSISGLDGSWCGIRTTGAVQCWGDDSYNVITNAPGGTSWTGGTIDAWSRHACARTSAGVLSCWGTTNYGVTTVPAGTYDSVAVMWNNTCAVTDTCTMECWGCQVDGGLGDCTVETVPAGTTFDKVFGGTDGFCALDNGGNVSCFWSNTLGFNIEENAPVTGCSTTPCGGAVAGTCRVSVIQ